MTTEAIAGPKARIQARRASAERLLDYADHLDGSDRALLRAVFDRGLTSTDLARVIGQEPRAVRRRVQRLVERIGSASFQFVMRNCDGWPSSRRQVGESIILRGSTQRRAAVQLGLSLHQVRQEIERIRALYEYQLQ